MQPTLNRFSLSQAENPLFPHYHLAWLLEIVTSHISGFPAPVGGCRLNLQDFTSPNLDRLSYHQSPKSRIAPTPAIQKIVTKIWSYCVDWFKTFPDIFHLLLKPSTLFFSNQRHSDKFLFSRYMFSCLMISLTIITTHSHFYLLHLLLEISQFVSLPMPRIT